jgi:methylated-DNA-[protein]-cysteine S-methyltransferase
MTATSMGDALLSSGVRLCEPVGAKRWFGVIASPLGELTVVSDGHALLGVHFDDASHALAREESWERDDELFAPVACQLAEYFDGTRQQFDLLIALTGTVFRRAVWQSLSDIAYGTTTSYGELARRLGHTNAYRAVGTANGYNPVAVVLPCHRVIAADGSLGGYGGGLWRKRFLLDLEKRSAAERLPTQS